MAKVNCNADDMEMFGILEVGTYFVYQNQLFVLISEYETEKDVFNFNEDNTFCWCDRFDTNAIVKVISPDKITINID